MSDIKPVEEKMVTKPTIYTEEFVLQEVNSLLKELRDDKDIVYKGQLFEHRKYSMQRYSEWAAKFEYHTEISETIEKIDELLLTRINMGGLKNELNAGMTKFNLINNYDWKEKNETDITTQGKSINITLDAGTSPVLPIGKPTTTTEAST
jgi:hypothetical protein